MQARSPRAVAPGDRGNCLPHGESPWGTFLKISQSLPKITRMKTRKDALHWSCTSWDDPSFPRQQIPRHPFLTHYKFLSSPVVVTWELSVPTASPPGDQSSHPQGYIQPRNSFSAGTEGLGKYLSAFLSSGKRRWKANRTNSYLVQIKRSNSLVPPSGVYLYPSLGRAGVGRVSDGPRLLRGEWQSTCTALAGPRVWSWGQKQITGSPGLRRG